MRGTKKMNVELTKGQLLDENGELSQAGYAFSLIKEYNRKQIRGLKWRIKEWDYYAILKDDYGIALTVADNSYMSLVSVSFLDFVNKKYVTKSHIDWLTFGKLNLPQSSKIGGINYQKKDYLFSFTNNGTYRTIKVKYPKFINDDDFTCDIVLTPKASDSIVVAIPFFKKGHFYYNQKINCLLAQGFFKIGNKEYSLDSASGVLDWGRGVWTYKNTWYWSSLSVVNEKETKGFNLGYGFGDTTKGSENVVFCNGKAYKLDDCLFNIPKNNGKWDYLKPWRITSSDLSINLIFTPIIDRVDCTDVLLIASKQHQVFGKFKGTIKVKDLIIEFNDELGFAERVYNKW